MFRVMLVNMPFANCDRPSLGLSLLKAALTREGIHCDVAYLNLSYARLVGRASYKRLADFNTNALLGEWIFAAALFGETESGALAYVRDVLQPLANGLDARTAVDDTSPERRQLLADLPVMRSRATAFLDACLSERDWRSYDLVGFTSTFQQNVPSLGMAQRLKRAFPHLTIAFGGANCEGEMGLALHRNFDFVDFVCSGEGDRAFPALVRRLAASEAPASIDGVIGRSAGGSAPPARMTDPVMDLDSLPFPDYDDFFEQHAAVFGSLEDVLMPIESSRGCWWGQKCHCTFCGLNGGTMNYRAKSPERFLAEVEELVGRYGVRNLGAVDNILDMTYFGSVLPRLKEKGLDLNLMYETKANLKEYQVRLLAECGIRHIQPGIESLSTNVLKLMRKGVHACQNVKLLRWCAEYLVQPAWNLLAGFPHENPDDYRAQTDLIPFLVHLAPPTGVTPVRIDRFSPLFVSGEKLGARRIRPVAAYSHVYPLEDAEREGLAYFFDCDYPPDQDLSAYVPKLKEAVDAWIAGADVGKLIALDDDATLAVCDGRRDARRRDYQLTGWRRLLYASCNDGRTMRQIEGVLVEAGYESVPAREIRDFLAELIDARLLLYVDECYLSLAIRGDHHFRLIAQRLSRGEEAQGALRLAAQRLLELHKTRFAKHLALNLTTETTAADSLKGRRESGGVPSCVEPEGCDANLLSQPRIGRTLF